MNSATGSCLIYASLLSLAESVILCVGGTIWSGQYSLDYLRITAVIFVAMTLISILTKAPVLAGALIMLRDKPQMRFRWSISILNVGVYAALILVILIPASILDSSAELPAGYLLYGALCFFTPQLPWLREPKHLSQQPGFAHSAYEFPPITRMNRRVPILPVTLVVIGLVLFFSLMTSVCSTVF